MYHELLHTKNSPLHALEFKTSLILFGNIPRPPPRVTLIWSSISLNNLVVISAIENERLYFSSFSSRKAKHFGTHDTLKYISECSCFSSYWMPSLDENLKSRPKVRSIDWYSYDIVFSSKFNGISIGVSTLDDKTLLCPGKCSENSSKQKAHQFTVARADLKIASV